MAAKSQSFKSHVLAGYRSAFTSARWHDGQSETGFQIGRKIAERDIALGVDDAEAAFMAYMCVGPAMFDKEGNLV